MDAPSRRRVKLYMLNEDRTWGDQGTGHVTSVYVDRLKGTSLLVRSENDGSLLLESKIQPHTAYQKQQDTLIVWSELDNDYALSFQEKAGCDEIWEKICQVQGKDPTLDLTQDCVLGEDLGDDMLTEDDRFQDSLHEKAPLDLPPCELSKLSEISELFTSCLMTAGQREQLATAIEGSDYVKKLLDLFRMCEDMEDAEGLHHLFDIFKSMFSLNKAELFEMMFTEENIMSVIGVLEYDPVYAANPRKHREFLTKKAHFKEVVPASNHELLQKIHQTYRIQYIQDVILPAPSVFEENMLSTLTSIIYFNKGDIVSMLQEDEKFLTLLFSQIKDDETDDVRRRDLVCFLKEFCTFSQNLQPDSKATFLKTLMHHDVLEAVEIVLGLDDELMKWAALEVFTYLLENSPSSVRDFIIRGNGKQVQDDEDILINLVIMQMISDTDPELGGAMQLMGTVRTLVDPENMLGTANKTEKTEFLAFFYKHSMAVLTAPLFANTVEDQPSKDDYRTCQLLALILELLTFCIEHHTYHVKNYIMNKDLLRRVLVLTKSRHTFLMLAALRLLRKVVGLKDEFYNRYIIRGDLFKPVIEAFVHNSHRYNLQNSAVIELFEFIRQEDVKSLMRYTIEKFYAGCLEQVSYVETFRQLKTRYDQQVDSQLDRTSPFGGQESGTPTILRNHRFMPRDSRTVDEDEEMWFDNDEDLEDTEPVLTSPDVFKPKTDMFEFSKFIERKSLVGNMGKEVDSPMPNRVRQTGPISISLQSRGASVGVSGSPPLTPTGSPNTSPIPSPCSSPTQLTNVPATSTTPSPTLSSSSLPTSSVVCESLRAASPELKHVQASLLTGLVDYPDDEEEEEDALLSSSSDSSSNSSDTSPSPHTTTTTSNLDTPTSTCEEQHSEDVVTDSKRPRLSL